MLHKFLAAASAAVLLAVPFAASAQSYAQGQPSYASAEENLHGRIVAFDGGYNLRVRDERGYVDAVQMHPGTIINPTGLTLAPGMVVSVLGYNAGPYLAANEIDTPYTFYGGVPWYGGHPWNYYGPSISLAFFFGNVGWWHGAVLGSPVYWVGGARVYRPVYVRGAYAPPVGSFHRVYAPAGGTYHGRNYVAPAARGGYHAHGASVQRTGGNYAHNSHTSAHAESSRVHH
jgi:hypothetical protein